MRRPAPTGLLLLLALSAAGCGSGAKGVDPKVATVADFATGTCLVIAADVLGVRSLGGELAGDYAHGDGAPLPEARSALVDVRHRLQPAVAKADKEVAASLRSLVQALDDVSRGLDANAYSAALPDQVRVAAEGVIRACT